RSEVPELNGLTFCMLGVAVPIDLVQDIRHSPFKIGRRIELEDFTLAEAAPLAARLLPAVNHEEHEGHEEHEADRAGEGSGQDRSIASSLGTRHRSLLLERILHWTGGHPYLTQRLCRAVAERAGSRTPADVDQICRSVFLAPGARERDDNLIFVRERLLRSDTDPAGVLNLYARLRRGHLGQGVV